MAEKPILFNTEMVKAILNGTKTQTRRVVRSTYKDFEYPLWEYLERLVPEKTAKDGWWTLNLDKIGNPYTAVREPYSKGDVLWVRETWADVSETAPGNLHFKASATEADLQWFAENGWKWRPSIHMPRKAARLFLRVTDVRVERLQDVSEDDVCREGAERIINSCWHMDFSVTPPEPCFNMHPCEDCIGDHSYPELFGKMVWNETLKPSDLPHYGWEANPWVWVIEFARIDGEPAGLYADRDTAYCADSGVLMPTT